MTGTRGRGGRRSILAAALVLLLVGSGCRASVEELVAEGETALKGYQLEEAEKAYLRALEIDPLRPEALYGLGWIYSSRRDTVTARIFYERCIEAAPRYYGGYKGMGSVHLALGFYDQAEASLKRAIELKPDEASSHGSLGYVYLVTRRLDLAEKAFQTALKLEPGRGEIHYLMAELRARQGAVDEALKELEASEGKPIEEVKFKLLKEQLKGQLLLQKVVRMMPGPGEPVPEPTVKEGMELLTKADKALDAALEMAFVEERHRLHSLKTKVRNARERLTGPPPI